MTEIKFCRDCGRGISTGSLIFFECPVDEKWKTDSAWCNKE